MRTRGLLMDILRDVNRIIYPLSGNEVPILYNKIVNQNMRPT